MRVSIFLFLALLYLGQACQSPDPNIGQEGVDELKSYKINRAVTTETMDYHDLIYVPIYSDVYINRANQKSLLAATLSIRNTSFADSLYVSTIDYYDSHGDKVRSYIKRPISLPPMATVNYVIEKEDDSGGSGANFIVSLGGSNPDIRPIVQAIMIGENGKNQGFAFSVDGYSIAEENRIVVPDTTN